MGKNQGWKDMQRGKHGDGDGAAAGSEDGMVDASWHTPEWHAARIASLQVERLPWDDWKKKQKDDAAKAALVEEDEERLILEHRAQLAADREKRLARGTNHADLKDSSSKKRKRKHKSKDKKKHKEKDSKDSKHKKSSKSKKSKKKKRSESDSSGSSSSDDSDADVKPPSKKREADSPIRLSDFLRA